MFIWIEWLVDWLIFDFLGFVVDIYLGVALYFFMYDIVKILLLLFLIIFVMGIVNVYFLVEWLCSFL